jgi:hypothetical protein
MILCVLQQIMKKQTAFIGILLFSMLIYGCSGKPGIPKIELSVTSFDLEDINPDEGKREEVFFIKNIGGAPLKILSVSTSCGCTVAEVELEEIPPGKQTPLTVIYDPSVHPGLVGKIKRIVYVQSNDPVQEEVELELIGNVLPSSKS